jgi:GT2 family glycosyltransferase
MDCRYEILLVDNASTDQTAEVIGQLTADGGGLVRGVCEPRGGVAAARNRGVAEARGPWIAFFDDDQLAQPDWLEELLATARATGAKCVGGCVALELPGVEAPALPAVCRGLLGELRGIEAPRRYTRKLMPGTGNLLVHRSLFAQLGVFDESLEAGGEDTDLYRRMRAAGVDAWLNPKAVVRHVIPPDRLEPAYMLWASQRIGWQLARRERREWGRPGFTLVAAARLGQTLAISVPRYLGAVLFGRPAARLGARCHLARSGGYLRGALSMLVPCVYGGTEFAARMGFRQQRAGRDGGSAACSAGEEANVVAGGAETPPHRSHRRRWARNVGAR